MYDPSKSHFVCKDGILNPLLSRLRKNGIVLKATKTGMRWWEINISRTCLLILPRSVFTNCGFVVLGRWVVYEKQLVYVEREVIMGWLETGSVVGHITIHMAHMEPCSKLQNKRLQQRATVILWEMCVHVNGLMKIVCGLYEIMSCGEQSQGQMPDPGQADYVTVTLLDQPVSWSCCLLVFPIGL